MSFQWLLLALLAQHIIPGLAAVPACTNPPTPYTVTDATGLEQVLASWSGTACEGTIEFSQSSVTYFLTAEIKWPDKGVLTLDASSASDVIIQAAPGNRIISTGMKSKLLVVGLEMRGGVTVLSESGGAVAMGESSSFNAIGTRFKNNHAGAAGAVFVRPGCTFKASQCEFFSNTAYVGGAIHASKNAVIKVFDSIFKNNTVGGTEVTIALGGAINLGYASGKSTRHI